MLAGCFSFLLMTMPLQVTTPVTPVTSEKAGARRPRFEFQSFGKGILEQSRLVAEARATSVIRAGRGVSVAHFELLEPLRGVGREKQLVVLAAPGQFRVGVTYLLFLDRFAESDRLTVVKRIAAGERDYTAKLRVLRQFLQADEIEPDRERALRIRAILLKNLGDSDLFIKWNALTELGPFVEQHRRLFGPGEKSRMVAVLRKDSSPSFRRELRRILTRLGIRFEK